MLKYEISESDHCRQVESFLQKLLPSASLSYLRKLLTAGHLTVNGAPALPRTVLRLGDTVALKESGKTAAYLRNGRGELDILLEDQWIMMFNKAPGLPMHRAAEVDGRNLVDLGGELLARRDGGSGKLRPVNRLDRGTSGAVILAKSPTAAAMFGRVIKEEGLGKLYLAIVEGELAKDGVITLPLAGKEAETRYRSLFHRADCTFVAVYPVTGRMHQIRQHFKSIGHPIRGDRRYGGKPLPGFAGIALHSFRTSIVHPATGEALRVFAPLPEEFRTLLKNLSGDGYLSVLEALPELP